MKCSFCQTEIEKGTGTMYVRKNGAIKYYCTNRCLKSEVRFRMKPRTKEIKSRDGKKKEK
jgi:large subunit ribosomal protein L24e